MNILLKIVLAISAFKATIVFLLLILAIIARMSGVDNILFPRLGLIVNTVMVMIMLSAIEIFPIAFRVFVWRRISKISLQ